MIKFIDSAQLDTALTATANAIRAKTGANGNLSFNLSTGFSNAISNIISIFDAYPVGSLYATDISDQNPSAILGFGTWTRLSSTDLIWRDVDLTWNNAVATDSSVYVWRRTA